MCIYVCVKRVYFTLEVLVVDDHTFSNEAIVHFVVVVIRADFPGGCRATSSPEKHTHKTNMQSSSVEIFFL